MESTDRKPHKGRAWFIRIWVFMLLTSMSPFNLGAHLGMPHDQAAQFPAFMLGTAPAILILLVMFARLSNTGTGGNAPMVPPTYREDSAE